MDNDWEQYELEATLREMLENGDESPASGARREASPQGAVLGAPFYRTAAASGASISRSLLYVPVVFGAHHNAHNK